MEKGKNSYKVCLMGASLETGNMGVSALAVSLIKNIRGIRPDADISFLIGNRTSLIRNPMISGEQVQIKVINYRLSPKAKIQEHLFWIFFMACLQRIVPFKSIRKKIILSNPWLKALSQADFLGDIRGGDSFSDIYGIKGIVVGSMPSILALLLGKKLFLLPQTYGPYKSFISKKIARYVLTRAACIISRDKEGFETVREIIGAENKAINIHFCPDVAFVLDTVRPGKIDIEPHIIGDTGYSLIGLNVNGLLYNGGYTLDNMFGLKYDYKTFVRNMVIRLMTDTDAHILLIPHTFAPNGHVESDQDACRDIIGNIENYYKNRVHMVMGEHDQFAIKGIIGLCDFFIGSRMHACIAALSQGIPTVGVAYSRKFAGVFESVGAGDMVSDARSVDMRTAIEDICMNFKNREQIGNILKTNIEAAKKQLVDKFEEILK